jgi:hypothetical protein
MSSNDSKQIEPMEGIVVRIRSGNEVLKLDYHQATAKSGKSLWWGTAVGYRAMQAAAVALSTDGLWSRDRLYVVSAHPGPGVIDSIDYVTDVVRRDRFLCVQEGDCGGRCNSSMKYEWWVSDGEKTATIKLRAGFVPRAFYDLCDRIGMPDTTKDEVLAMEVFKVNLSASVWNAPLTESFRVTVTPRPLEVGETPEPVKSPHYWDDLRAEA